MDVMFKLCRWNQDGIMLFTFNSHSMIRHFVDGVMDDVMKTGIASV